MTFFNALCKHNFVVQTKIDVRRLRSVFPYDFSGINTELYVCKKCDAYENRVMDTTLNVTE